MRALLTVGLITTVAACAAKSNGGAEGASSALEPAPMACTEIGCQDGLLIRVTPGAAWPAGQYTFTTQVDGQTIVCTGSLPLPACGTAAITCDAEGVLVTESGCALPPAEHAFGDLTLPTPVESCSVTIEHDGAEVASGSWTPEYETLQPNGPDCEPTCTFASVELAVSFD